MIQRIVLFNQFHIGDAFISQGLVRCAVASNPDYTILVALPAAFMLYAGISNLGILDTKTVPALANDIVYDQYIQLDENTLAVNLWYTALGRNCGGVHAVELQYARLHGALRGIFDTINAAHGTRLTLADWSVADLIPVLPTYSIDPFLAWKASQGDRKLVLYHNYEPKSGQNMIRVSHTRILKELCCALPHLTFIAAVGTKELRDMREAGDLSNLVCADDIGIVPSRDCANLCILAQIRKHCAYSVHFDIGAAFLYATRDLMSSPCVAIHTSVDGHFYRLLRKSYDVSDTEYAQRVILDTSPNENALLVALQNHLSKA